MVSRLSLFVCQFVFCLITNYFLPAAALNEETLDLMHRPRCGNKDMVKVEGRRSKRFALHGSR